MQRVLITGATGFIGNHLTHKMVAEGFDVHILMRSESRMPWNAQITCKITVHHYDGTIESMQRSVQAAKPDLVIHLASLFIAEHRPQDVSALVLSNIMMGAHLLEAMQENGVKHLVNTGTLWQHYLNEAYEPVNLYAATKQAFEDLASYYVKSSSLKMLTLKLYDTYGLDDRRGKLISLFQKMCQSGELLKMSPGEQKLGLVYIDDVVNAYKMSVEAVQQQSEASHESYFVVPKAFYSLKETAAIFEKVNRCKLNIEWGGRPYRNREIMKPFVGEKLPDWEAEIDLEQGLERMLES